MSGFYACGCRCILSILWCLPSACFESSGVLHGAGSSPSVADTMWVCHDWLFGCPASKRPGYADEQCGDHSVLPDGLCIGPEPQEVCPAQEMGVYGPDSHFVAGQGVSPGGQTLEALDGGPTVLVSH